MIESLRASLLCLSIYTVVCQSGFDLEVICDSLSKLCHHEYVPIEGPLEALHDVRTLDRLTQDLLHLRLVISTENQTFSDVPGGASTQNQPRKLPPQDLPGQLLSQVPGETPTQELPEQLPSQVPEESSTQDLPEQLPSQVPEETSTQDLPEQLPSQVPREQPSKVPGESPTQDLPEQQSYQVPREQPSQLPGESPTQDLPEQQPSQVPGKSLTQTLPREPPSRVAEEESIQNQLPTQDLPEQLLSQDTRQLPSPNVHKEPLSHGQKNDRIESQPSNESLQDIEAEYTQYIQTGKLPTILPLSTQVREMFDSIRKRFTNKGNRKSGAKRQKTTHTYNQSEGGLSLSDFYDQTTLAQLYTNALPQELYSLDAEDYRRKHLDAQLSAELVNKYELQFRYCLAAREYWSEKKETSVVWPSSKNDRAYAVALMDKAQEMDKYCPGSVFLAFHCRGALNKFRITSTDAKSAALLLRNWDDIRPLLNNFAIGPTLFENYKQFWKRWTGKSNGFPVQEVSFTGVTGTHFSTFRPTPENDPPVQEVVNGDQVGADLHDVLSNSAVAIGTTGIDFEILNNSSFTNDSAMAVGVTGIDFDILNNSSFTNDSTMAVGVTGINFDVFNEFDLELSNNIIFPTLPTHM